MKQKAITPDIDKCYCGADAGIVTWEEGHEIVYRVKCSNNHTLSKYCGTRNRAVWRWNNRLKKVADIKTKRYGI